MNASDAIGVLARNPIDVVVIDLELPSGGFTVLQAAMDRNLPAIAVSSHPSPFERASTYGLPVRAFLMKPIDPSTVCDTIVEALQSHRRS